MANDQVSVTDAVFRFDALHYAHVVADGYVYESGQRSEVAFFPVYPLAGRAVAQALGLGAQRALLVVSNISLLAAMVLLARYTAVRQTPDQRTREHYRGEEEEGALGGDEGQYSLKRRDWCALAVFALFPTTFFFHIGYAESLLVLLCILALYGMERRWPLAVIALVVGLATAVRPVGVALLAPLVWHVWTTSASRGQFARRLALAAPLAVWGLAAFVLFQYREFGDPLAFARTQVHWQARGANINPLDKTLALLSGQAIWAVYDPGDPAYWGHWNPAGNPLLNWQFLAPVYFVGTAVLVIVGALKGWLTRNEWLLSAGLLLIPYVTKAYENCFLSQARFAAVVFPAYIVLGELLARLPRVVAVLLLLGSAATLAYYSARFAAGEAIF